MPRAEYDRYEQDALSQAIDAGGTYLHGIGQMDVSQLDDVQIIIFAKTIIDTFGKALAERLQNLEPAR
ncbi:hypothetical protein V5F77_04265 [Xanthobacter sp. DSM 24535]|uniref:hypothetical protein n=1 Tax=Roseixanthobacter psychrophilus TaxID=3119917 RepID=UPI003726305C